MSDMVKLSELELNKLISTDEEFKNLYYTSSVFNKTINALSQGLDADDVVNIFKILCQGNENLIKENIRLSKYKNLYCL